jgi:alpha-glucosidase (family GH31 glycosyl hydrolase)
MIGPDLMMVTVTSPDLTAVPVYLPAGGWFNYHTGEFFQSEGQWIEVPAMVDGMIRAPLFVRDGAVLPLMAVDDQTMNLLGQRRDLIINVYSREETQGSFTLIEDDGQTMAYQNGEVMETPIIFDGNSVKIEAANGTYDDAPQTRPVEIHVINGPGKIEPISATYDTTTSLELTLPESVNP